MKAILSSLNKRTLCLIAACAAVVSAGTQAARAAYVAYPTPNIENPVVYSFTAASSGHIIAYYAGSTASYENQLGLRVNGTDTGIYGLDNQSTAFGTALDFGLVTAGDSLVFVLKNIVGLVPPGQMAFSDPSLNGPYDGLGPGPGHNHVYATPYTHVLAGDLPSGTFVAFEDLPAYAPPDWNYNDEDFVFVNVAVSTPDAGSTMALLGMGLAGIGLIRGRFSRGR